jgi:hypothetical protein
MTTDKSELTPVPDLPWYESLRLFLEPYEPSSREMSDKQFSSTEIIRAIEAHHGVPQGIVGKEIYVWMSPEDFVRAMRYLGYREENVSGTELEWLMRKK